MDCGITEFGWDDVPLDAFERTVLAGAQRVAADHQNPIRGNLYAAGIRELLGSLMHRLAPDDEVKACWWYAQALDTKGPTRRQRAMFMTQGGLPKAMLDGLDFDLPFHQGLLVKAIEGLNRLTHVRPGTVLHDGQEITFLEADILSGLAALFGALEVCRTAVAETVAEAVDEPAAYALADENLAKVDILASHYTTEDVEPGGVEVKEIRAREVTIEVTGSLSVKLQWGSGGDMRRGDGATMWQRFPFVVTMAAPVDDLTALSVIDRTVDTDAWYGAEDDD